MIIHVFTANRTHLVPSIIRGFIEKITGEHFFLLASDSEFDKTTYENLFSKYSHKRYKFVTSFFELIAEAKKYKNNYILLHGVPYHWMLYFTLFGFKNVNWICWGTGAKINDNIKSKLSAPLKKLIYKRFDKVITLMEQDSKSLKEDFGINSTVIPYMGLHYKFPYSRDHLEKNKLDVNNIVYIGNNSSALSTYQPMIEKLSKFNKKIKVKCMLNYSFKKSKMSDNLIKRGQELFGENFSIDTKLYSLNEYYEYMDKCDIYICAVEKQTGLSAIYTALRLGKKLFLKGKNYEWIKSLGCKVFHVDGIDTMNIEDFTKPLPLATKYHNHALIIELLNEDKLINKWNSVLAYKKNELYIHII